MVACSPDAGTLEDDGRADQQTEEVSESRGEATLCRSSDSCFDVEYRALPGGAMCAPGVMDERCLADSLLPLDVTSIANIAADPEARTAVVEVTELTLLGGADRHLSVDANLSWLPARNAIHIELLATDGTWVPVVLPERLAEIRDFDGSRVSAEDLNAFETVDIDVAARALTALVAKCSAQYCTLSRTFDLAELGDYEFVSTEGVIEARVRIFPYREFDPGEYEAEAELSQDVTLDVNRWLDEEGI